MYFNDILSHYQYRLTLGFILYVLAYIYYIRIFDIVSHKQVFLPQSKIKIIANEQLNFLCLLYSWRTAIHGENNISMLGHNTIFDIR